MFGMEAPVFTRVSRSFGVTLGYLKDQTSGLLYPVTEEETKALREQFPKETLKILEKSTGEMKEPHKGEENTGAIGRQEESQKEDAVFALDQVSFSYTADTPVLQGLDLTLDTRPTAIVGQNGAGKTTLTQAMKGRKITYHKTQYINNYDVIIDTPRRVCGEQKPWQGR